MRTHSFDEPLSQMGMAFSGRGHVLQEIKSAEDAVAFGYMAPESEPTALFASDEGAYFAHFGSDVLETHRSLVDIDFVGIAKSIQSDGRSNALDQRASQLLLF